MKRIRLNRCLKCQECIPIKVGYCDPCRAKEAVNRIEHARASEQKLKRKAERYARRVREAPVVPLLYSCRVCGKRHDFLGAGKSYCSMACHQKRANRRRANRMAADAKAVAASAPVAARKRHEFYDSDAWRRLRYQAIRLYGRTCMACGRTDGVMHVDHIKPRSKHPALELALTNLQILCRDCNLGKSAWDETDWRPHAMRATQRP